MYTLHLFRANITLLIQRFLLIDKRALLSAEPSQFACFPTNVAILARNRIRYRVDETRSTGGF